MRRLVAPLCLVAVACTADPTAPPAAPASDPGRPQPGPGAAGYVVTDLGLSFGGRFSRANAINATGQIAGAAEIVNPITGVRRTAAVVWSLSTGAWTVLPNPANDDIAEAVDINDQGEVLIQSRKSNQFGVRSWIWLPSAGSTLPVAPAAGGAVTVEARAIDNNSMVAGGYGQTSVLLRPFTFNKMLVTFTPVAVPAAYPGESIAMTVATAPYGFPKTFGFATAGGAWANATPFVWNAGVFVAGAPVGLIPVHVSETGWLAGWLTDPAGLHRAVLQPAVATAAGGTDLGLGESEATSVSAKGRVVGWRRQASGGTITQVAFAQYRTQAATLVALAALGSATTARYANDVDPCGNVVGNSIGADGRQHAVVWKISACDP